MNRFSNLTGRATGFADGMGETMKALVPNAGRLLQTGMKLGVVKKGARAAGLVVRRYPVVTAATIVGGGLLWYAAHRRARRAEAAGYEHVEHGSGYARDAQPMPRTTRRVDAQQEDSGTRGGKRAAGGATSRKRGARNARGGSESRGATH